jgi:hypothetical protein
LGIGTNYNGATRTWCNPSEINNVRLMAHQNEHSWLTAVGIDQPFRCLLTFLCSLIRRSEDGVEGAQAIYYSKIK